MEVSKSLIRRKIRSVEQTLAELSSDHRRLQAKCKIVKTGYIIRLNCS